MVPVVFRSELSRLRMTTTQRRLRRYDDYQQQTLAAAEKCPVAISMLLFGDWFMCVQQRQHRNGKVYVFTRRTVDVAEDVGVSFLYRQPARYDADVDGSVKKDTHA